MPRGLTEFPKAEFFQYCPPGTEVRFLTPELNAETWAFWTRRGDTEVVRDGRQMGALEWYEIELRERGFEVQWVRRVTPFWIEFLGEGLKGEIHFIPGVDPPEDSGLGETANALLIRVYR